MEILQNTTKTYLTSNCSFGNFKSARPLVWLGTLAVCTRRPRGLVGRIAQESKCARLSSAVFGQPLIGTRSAPRGITPVVRSRRPSLALFRRLVGTHPRQHVLCVSLPLCRQTVSARTCRWSTGGPIHPSILASQPGHLSPTVNRRLTYSSRSTSRP